MRAFDSPLRVPLPRGRHGGDAEVEGGARGNLAGSRHEARSLDDVACCLEGTLYIIYIYNIFFQGGNLCDAFPCAANMVSLLLVWGGHGGATGYFFQVAQPSFEFLGIFPGRGGLHADALKNRRTRIC